MRESIKFFTLLSAFTLFSCESLSEDEFEAVTLSAITATTTCVPLDVAACVEANRDKASVAQLFDDTCANLNSSAELLAVDTTELTTCGAINCTTTHNNFASVPFGDTTVPGGNYCMLVSYDIDSNGIDTGDVKCTQDITLDGSSGVSVSVSTCSVY